MFAVIAPCMLVPTLLGARLYVGLSEVTFRKIVLALLTGSGFALLVASPRIRSYYILDRRPHLVIRT